ncbi:MAG: tetratricopeptide repeat protein [Pirellula sp.]
MSDNQQKLLAAWRVHQQGNIAAARQVYEEVLRKDPNDANAWCYLGIALHDQKRYGQAVEAYEKAISLQPSFPIALNNLGNSLRYLGRIEESDQRFQQAIDIKPDYFNAYRNRGTLHAWTGRIDLALKHYADAMRLEPQDAELHRNLGVINLLQGNFDVGWQEYRHRWKCAEAVQHRYSQPKWAGEDLRGKTILLYAEQGLGDTIHFVRYAKILRDRGARTIVHAQAQLMAILQGCPGISSLIPNTWNVEEPFDYHCSLIDVADVLKTDLSNIPGDVPYIKLPENLVGYWKRKLQELLPPAKRRIGLVWQGNPDHQADMFRSFPLAALESLSHLEDVQLVSLQFGRGGEQIQQWTASKPIHTLPEEIDRSSGAFMDTAAILHHLDWIVTSDTSMAHLAGALGRPTMILLGFTPDWRWLLDRDDSPWYPTAKLVRQKTIGQWHSVGQQAAELLAEEFRKSQASTP